MRNTITGKVATREVYIGANRLNPSVSRRIVNHSPDGFQWGYGGSGPSQLALSILLCYTGQENAIRLYQDFKWDVVAKLEGDFKLPEADVVNWINNKLKEKSDEL